MDILKHCLTAAGCPSGPRLEQQVFPGLNHASFLLLRTLASHWNKEMFRCYEAKIEESEKAGSRRESNPGHLACAIHIEDCEGWWLSGCAVMKVPFFVFFFLSCYNYNINITVAN